MAGINGFVVTSGVTQSAGQQLQMLVSPFLLTLFNTFGSAFPL